MEECIFCHTMTSYKFKGTAEYNRESIFPKCKSEKFATNFNTGCASDDDCKVKLKKE